MFSSTAAKIILAVVLCLSIALMVASCGMVSDPPEEVVVTDVRDYYFKLDGDAKYHYERYLADGSEEYLGMEMKGKSNSYYQGRQTYLCMWDYYKGTKWPYYFALDDQAAVYLATSQNPEAGWVDLQSPLKLGATWSFTYEGNDVAAKVTKIGSTAMVDSTTFTDVMEVTYTSVTGTKLQWFVRDIGLIYAIEKDAEGKLVYSQEFRGKD